MQTQVRRPTSASSSRRLLDEISKEKGLHLVFGIQQAAIIWWSPAVDISDECVKRLDAAK